MKKNNKTGAGRLRIIGGEWRSRLLEFKVSESLRPTPDRVRQTAFDWLAPLINGADCLDLYAGSGALGFEALSRGAAHATFVESDRAVANQISANIEKFGATKNSRVQSFLAEQYLQMNSAGQTKFDVVFLDPPYADKRLESTLRQLPPLLKPTHRVFCEWSRRDEWTWPEGWIVHKEKTAGQVRYALATYQPATPESQP